MYNKPSAATQGDTPNPLTAAYGQPSPSSIPIGVPLFGAGGQDSAVPMANYAVVQPLKPTQVRGEVQNESKYRDAWAAVLFIVMFAAVAFVGLKNAGSALGGSTSAPTPAPSGSGPSLTSAQLHRIFTIGATLLAMGAALSLCWLLLLIRLAERMIRVTLKLSAAMFLAIAAVLAAKGAAIPAAVCALLGMLTLCYYYCVQGEIPFAGANLSVACEAVQAHRGTIGVSFLALVLQLAWMLLWILCAASIYRANAPVCTNAQQMCERKVAWGPYFGLLVSFFWGLQVFRNVSHTTTAGAVGSWWFRPQDTAVVGGALRRACTWSFGSICFGSLLVAILRALEQMARNARKGGGEEGALACVLECILAQLRALLEWINRWAFTYVGIYGYSFAVAGQAVFDLFKTRGWTMIINDGLIENTLSLVALMNGALCAGVGVALVTAEKSSFQGAGLLDGGDLLQQAQIAVAVVGFLVGLAMSTVVMSVVESAACTVFVGFAQDPNALRVGRPAAHHRLMLAYMARHRGVLVQCGYIQ